MIYLFLFIAGVGLIFLIQWGRESVMSERFFSQKETALQSGEKLLSNDEPIVVYMHHGIRIQEELEFYVEPDGLLLCSEATQYHIPLRNIVRVTVDMQNGPIDSKSLVKRFLAKMWKDKVHYVVIGYKNASQKLKVLTLHVPELTNETINKLNSLI
ncbi:hypothetical protein J0B03_02050 [Alkalibacter rhizosphaerae]|uniref:Uncharacterized protein n=1 Tax=Alkalibacter rhizosphaerae TaxID=2815577 RepID=A0A975AIU3_9FIRM|nr:hypothetical protein [Alkalibacter rhizosphaerae]QSX08890.1 hypothetical protein J0B03_02050 [Alkalibacter rhizosphaerae]